MSSQDEWPEFLTVAEIAKIMRVSKMTVYRMVNSGKLESVCLGNRSLRVYAASVRRLIRPDTS